MDMDMYKDMDLKFPPFRSNRSRVDWLNPYSRDMYNKVTVITKKWVCCANCGYESSRRTARKLGLQSGSGSRGDSAIIVDKLQEEGEGAHEKQQQLTRKRKKMIIRVHSWREQVIISVNAPADFELNLDYLPCYQQPPEVSRPPFNDRWDPEYKPQCIVASSNGLLLSLSSSSLSHQSQYYICNPLTKQWFALPPSPHLYGICNPGVVFFGFIYHPCAACFDTVNNNHDLMSCTNCSFKVVQFPRLVFEVHTYSSEVGKWSKAMVQSPKSFHWGASSVSKHATVHNGCLYWPTGSDWVIYDPYYNKIHGFINGPPRSQMCETHDKGHLLEFRGSLRLAQYSPISGFLRIWELKNSDRLIVDAGGNLKLDDCYWSPYRLCHFSEMNGGFNWFTKGSHVDDILAFHPINPDIVFMQLKMGTTRGYFTECNLRNKTMRRVKLMHPCHRLAADVHTLIFHF